MIWVWVWLGMGCGDTSATVHCDRDPPLSYDNFGEAFVVQYCTGCHATNLPEGLRQDAPVGIDFDFYDGVLLWADRVEIRALGENPGMPPGGGPSAEELVLLQEWLTCAVLPEAEAGGSQ